MLSFVHYHSPTKVAILTAFQCTQTCQGLDYINNQSKPNTSLVKITKESSTSKYTFVFTSHIIEVMQKTQTPFLTSRHVFENLLSRTINSSARLVPSTLQTELCSMKTEGLLPKHWLGRRYFWVNVGVGRSSREASQAVLHFHKLKKLEWRGRGEISGNGRNHLWKKPEGVSSW